MPSLTVGLLPVSSIATHVVAEPRAVASGINTQVESMTRSLPLAVLKRFINPNAFCYPATTMSSNLDQLTAEAMKLPLRERVQLAQRLVSTLDDEVETDTEALWFAEAERRLEELRSGKVQGIDSDEAFRTAREAIR